MKLLFASLLLLGMAAPAQAGTPIRSPGNLGLGLGGGTHASGVSVKYFPRQDLSLQGVVGWWGAGRESGGIGLSLDLLWEGMPLVQTDVFDLGWAIGPGANLGVGQGVLWLGAGGVLGVEFNFNTIPIDVVLEYRPGLLILPDVSADLIGFGAHVRVYPF